MSEIYVVSADLAGNAFFLDVTFSATIITILINNYSIVKKGSFSYKYRTLIYLKCPNVWVNEQIGWSSVINESMYRKWVAVSLLNSCCNRELLEVLVNDHYCIWSSVMKKWKNILGSRKKGAQEPHAGRELRYDNQGYTTSNLKGISLERLTLPAGITSNCMCPLFFQLFPLLWGFLSDRVEHVFVFCLLSPYRKLGPDAGWVPESGGCGHWYGLSV